MLEIGQTIADRYELLRQLGRGGFSEVWLAQDKLTDIQVAIKIYAPGMGLDEAGISLFTQEFSLVFDMNHTNLLHPTHYDCWQRMPYLILPYCKNGSAFKYLAEGQHITEEESWRLLHDVAEGLAYLHTKTPPVIHQDIKPDNILLNDENGYMITDFGISARIRSTLRRNQGQDSSGGTLAYMGPERFGPSPAPIMASDIWSLGATMYELLTGMPPYGDHGGVLQKNGADIPLIEGDFSQEMKEVIYRCLALNPWDRPMARQIADYAQQRLNGSTAPFEAAVEEPETLPEEAAGEATAEEQPPHRSEPPVAPPQWRRKRGVVLAAVALCAAVVAGIAWPGGGEEAPDEPAVEPLPAVDYDQICRSILQEGENYRIQGDTLRFDIDSLKQHSRAVFEDFYLDAIHQYRRIESYKDSISAEIGLEAARQSRLATEVLDSAYRVFDEKARLMKELDQEAAARAFEERAKKIEPYINIERNENE